MYLKSFGKPLGAVFRKSSPITGKYFLNSGSSTIANKLFDIIIDRLSHSFGR